MNFELAYATSQRPLPTMWASGLLIIGGVFFLLPILFTTLVGRPWLNDLGLATLLVTTAAVGVAQLAAARGAWRGASWPRAIVLAVIAVEVASLILGYLFVIIGLVLAGTAAFLLWRQDARAYSAAIREAGQRHQRS
jgi:hypothetical protein